MWRTQSAHSIWLVAQTARACSAFGNFNFKISSSIAGPDRRLETVVDWENELASWPLICCYKLVQIGLIDCLPSYQKETVLRARFLSSGTFFISQIQSFGRSSDKVILAPRRASGAQSELLLVASLGSAESFVSRFSKSSATNLAVSSSSTKHDKFQRSHHFFEVTLMKFPNFCKVWICLLWRASTEARALLRVAFDVPLDFIFDNLSFARPALLNDCYKLAWVATVAVLMRTMSNKSESS